RKSPGLQLIQDRRKSLRKRWAGITDKYDLKTGCKQISAYFIWRSEETGCGRGGPRQRVAGFSHRAGARQDRASEPPGRSTRKASRKTPRLSEMFIRAACE